MAGLPEGAEERVVDEVDDAAPAHVVNAGYQRALLGGNRHLPGVSTEGPALVARGQHGYVALLEGREAAAGGAQRHVVAAIAIGERVRVVHCGAEDGAGEVVAQAVAALGGEGQRIKSLGGIVMGVALIGCCLNAVLFGF